MTTPAMGRSGLQLERTGLAWIRTAVSMMVASAAVVRLAVFHGSVPAVVLGCLSLVAWLALVALATRRYRYVAERLSRDGTHTTMIPGGFASGAVVLLAAATFLLCVLPPD